MVRTKVKAKTRTIVVPMEKLEVCPHNPRKRDLDIDELTESIKQGGIKEVIEVHPHEGKWHIMAGQRRFLAAKKAGKTEVECLEYPFNEKQAEEWCMHDAFHKKEYHPLDLADLAVKAVEKYGSISKASKATGISQSKLKKYHGMKGLVKEVREKAGSPGTNSVDLRRQLNLSMMEFIVTKPRPKGLRCVKELQKYIPKVGRNVSLRHCYYYLFSKGLISPTKRDYQNLSSWLEWGKRYKLIPWDWIIDTSRETHKLSLSGNILGYVYDHVRKYYTRDYWREQDYLIILLCEKEALAPSITDPIATYYGVPIFVTRGYVSYGSLYQDIVKFLRRYKDYYLDIVVFVLTDFDVDGWLIFKDIKDKFAYAKKEWGIQTYDIKRIALTQKQIQQLNLKKFEYPIFKHGQPDYVNLLKKYGWRNFPTSKQNKRENLMSRRLTKAKSFIQKYGWKGVELDVLTPKQLTKIILKEMNPYFNFQVHQLELEKERLEKEAFFADLLLIQYEIDNALDLKDIQKLDKKLSKMKKQYGIP